MTSDLPFPPARGGTCGPQGDLWFSGQRNVTASSLGLECLSWACPKGAGRRPGHVRRVGLWESQLRSRVRAVATSRTRQPQPTLSPHTPRRPRDLQEHWAPPKLGPRVGASFPGRRLAGTPPSALLFAICSCRTGSLLVSRKASQRTQLGCKDSGLGPLGRHGALRPPPGPAAALHPGPSRHVPSGGEAHRNVWNSAWGARRSLSRGAGHT